MPHAGSQSIDEKARYRRALAASVCVHAALLLAGSLLLARATRFGPLSASAPEAPLLPQALLVQLLPEPEQEGTQVAPPEQPVPEPPPSPQVVPPPEEEPPPAADSDPVAAPEVFEPPRQEVPAPPTAQAPAPVARPASELVQAAAVPAPVGISLLLVPPSYLDTPSPVYPAVARRRGLEGRVLLDARITSSGEVEKLSTRESSGHKSLDDAAVAAVRKWRFHPARLGGIPVPASSLIPIRFQLDEPSVGP